MAEVPFFDLGAQARDHRSEYHAALDEVIDSGYFVGGAAVERFEHAWAQRVGAEHGVGVGNGLDAIRLILEGYGIGMGDEVIVPAFTYYASWLAVQQVGATLVPVDVELATAAIDVRAVEAAITSETRAILAVHLFGIPADLAALGELARANGIKLIEDAAQAHGAVRDGLQVGSGSDAAAFSFYPTKNLGALGDAGGVTTDDSALAMRIRSRRSYGQGAQKYEHVDTGWNTRLDPLQAAFLSIHLRELDQFTARRREIASVYWDALGDSADYVVGPRDVTDSVWHHFVVRAADRAELRGAFSAHGVATDVHYPYSIRDIRPLDPFVRLAEPSFDRAEALGREVVSLPMGPWMSDAQVDQVAETLRVLPRELFAAG
ncbi:MAG TPA: DegT/DnrJ/EryC1/StrS family aminotransferase [Microbacteriaceae bacterium]|nr:DegT/DnrJ/EryC1/StrS family aminotransferase [Microbacteriaceae bacterium]